MGETSDTSAGRDEDSPEKRVKIRPRPASWEREDVREAEEEEKPRTRIEEVKRNRLKQTGTAFPAKAETREREPRGEPEISQPRPDAKAEPRVGPELAEPESVRSPAPEDRELERPGSAAETTAPESAATAGDDPEKTWGKQESREENAAARAKRRARAKAARRRALLQTGRFVWTHRVRTFPALVVVGFLFWLGAQQFYRAGVNRGMVDAQATAVKENERLTPDQMSGMNAALEQLRNGDPDGALTALMEFQEQHPQVASLSYLIGLAAMQSGDNSMARELVRESIGKRERLSDSLALEAILETKKRADPSVRTMGDVRVRSEDQLRQAIAVDPANPYPMILLGTFLRYQGRTDEAREMLEGARARLQPLDSETVLNVSLALMNLAETSDAALPEANPNAQEATEIFSGALIAFRQGQNELAVNLLRRAEERMEPGVFRHLVNDPALRRYFYDPDVRRLFQRQ